MAAENGLTYILSTFAIALLICILVMKWIREWNYPLGPRGLPLLGYGIFLGENPHKKLKELSKKYGDMFSFYIGPQLNICISDYQLAKEIMTHPLMLFRPPYSFEFLIGRGGFSGMNGQEWLEQRRFCMYTMRNLGMGKGLWETMIQESAESFVNELRSTEGEPVNFDHILTYSQATNSISLLFGRHLDKVKDADDIKIIHEATVEIMKLFSAVGINMSAPWLIKYLIFLRIGGYNKPLLLLRQFENIFRREVEARMKSPESLTKEDFIGCYFKEMNIREKEGTPHTFSVETLLGNLFILFIAGNDSTLAGMSWLLLLMAAHQDIQKKVHDEIDKVVGKDGTIYHEDKFKLPYTMATIFEMTRWVSISAIFPPRYAADTFEFNGYTVPQGCYVICNIWAIMRDPKYFENPEEFIPERFLSKNGEKTLKLDGYAPFSFGKRNCPGEGVAIMTLFLYFVSVMQKLKVTLPPNCEADLKPKFSGGLLPKPQKLCFKER